MMTSSQHIFLRHYALNSLSFRPEGWNPGEIEYFQGEPGTPDLSDAVWWPVGDKSQAPLRMVSYECESLVAARSFLLDLLGEFQLPGIKRVYESDCAGELIGDVAFSGPDQLVLLFARANLVVLIQNARATSTPVFPFAREIDARIQSNPESRGEELIEMDQFYLPDCEFHIGDEIPIHVKQKRSLDEEPLYRFFAPSGELFIRGDQVVYRASTAGIQSIVAFAERVGKKTARQELKLSAEPQTNAQEPHPEKELLKRSSHSKHYNTRSGDPQRFRALDSNNLEEEEESAMRHNVIGKWSSILPTSDDEKTSLEKKGQFEITEMNNLTGKVKGYYTDNDEVRVPLEGCISYAGQDSYTVTLWHRIQPGLNRLYEGQLATADEGDHPHYIVAGRYRSVQESSTAESEPSASAESGQDNGTWVATKP